MRTLLTVVFCAALSISARAQTLDINFDALAAKAKDKAEITLEGPLLTQALQMAPDKVKGAAANVSRLMLRHYEFENAGQYSDSDLDAVRKQVSNGSGWSRVLNVKEEHESTEIYMLSQNGKPGGFLLISAEPKELTVIHVVGTIDLARLREVVNSTIHYDLKGTAGQ
jgi:peptidyl-tRNA hydrolase